MLKNAYLLAKIGADTAENERNFVDILPKIGNYPTGRVRRDRTSSSGRPPRSSARWSPSGLGAARDSSVYGLKHLMIYVVLTVYVSDLHRKCFSSRNI